MHDGAAAEAIDIALVTAGNTAAARAATGPCKVSVYVLEDEHDRRVAVQLAR